MQGSIHTQNLIKNNSLNLHLFKSMAVVRLSAMGDCILLQPTLLRILKHCPSLEIDWYIDRNWAPLFPKVDRLNLIPISKPKKLKDYFELKKQYFHKQYDVLLAMQASLRSNFLYSFINAPLKIGFDKQRAKDGQFLWTNAHIQAGEDHLCDGFARFADVLGIPAEAKTWNIASAGSDSLPPAIKTAIEQKRILIGINPAASKLERTPIVEFWTRLFEYWKELSTLDVDPIFVIMGGPSKLEADLAQQIMLQNSTGLEILNFVGKTNLLELSELLKQMHCLISPDSGPVHLANALGTPVVGLYAVAPSKLSGPYNYQHLTFDRYPEALVIFKKTELNEVKWGTRVHNRDAMNLINPYDVAQRVLQLLADDKQLTRDEQEASGKH